jgi:hypothetical protein
MKKKDEININKDYKISVNSFSKKISNLFFLHISWHNFNKNY